MGRITVRRPVTKLTVGAEAVRRADTLAVEEPLEIRVGGLSLAVTMRTPGNDVELAAGFLVSEGVISRGDQFRSAIHCGGPGTGGPGTGGLGTGGLGTGGLGTGGPGTGGLGSGGLGTGILGAGMLGSGIPVDAATDGNTYNILDVTLAPGVRPPDPELARAFYTTSSCGLCGKASIDAVRTVSMYDVATDDAAVDAATLSTFPDALRAQQAVFDKTGGLHAAALFDAASGDLLVLREDVGRHNAVDKVIGWAVLNDRLPLRGVVLQVSGRASFELVQKAVMAGIPILAAVSAPSSLAVELAASTGVTLIGFLRGSSMNIYTRDDRIADESPTARPRASTSASG